MENAAAVFLAGAQYFRRPADENTGVYLVFSSAKKANETNYTIFIGLHD
jgi:hypothetical protein